MCDAYVSEAAKAELCIKAVDLLHIQLDEELKDLRGYHLQGERDGVKA